MFTTSSNDTQSGKIGLLQTTSLVTGNLIGSGVFMLPSLLAVYGTVSLAGWLATSAGAIFLALVFSALSKEIHGCNGGPHLFIQRAFGDGAGYYAAWGYWLLTWASNTALLVAAMSYLVKITGPLSMTALLSIQVSIWSLVVLINSYGVQSAARFELLTTVLKLIPIIGIPLFACTSMQWRQFLPLFPAAETTTMWSGLQASIFLTLWAFIGVESATVPSKDVFQPEKTIGRATILGTSLAALVYVLGSAVAIGVLGHAALAQSTAPYADLATSVFGGRWGVFVSACAVISCVGAFNGWTMVVARIAEGAAEQGLFAEIFAFKDQRQTPIAALLISSACTLVALLFTLQENMLSQFNAIIDIAVTIILLIYFGCAIAYFVLLKPKSTSERFVGIGAVLFSLFALYASGVKMVSLALLLLVLGTPFRAQSRHEQTMVIPQ